LIFDFFPTDYDVQYPRHMAKSQKVTKTT